MGSAEGRNMCDLPTPTLFKSRTIKYYYCTCIRKTNFEMKHYKTRIVYTHTHTYTPVKPPNFRILSTRCFYSFPIILIIKSE